ncbi:MAG: AAA family ATPase [Muribaculaceae bacterium]|nr:AAA family ATPase [Muribaculaceae bacterium]
MENRFKLADMFIGTLRAVIDLYNNIWSENTTCLLHSPRDCDKSAMAVDIALSITARDIPVFYLTANRLSDKLLGKMRGNRRLYIHQSEFSAPDDPTDFADIVFKDLEDAIAQTDVKVFVVDSLSRIASLSFGRNASPSFLMKRLIALQVRHKVSILVLSHDTTKAATRALVNLADSELTMPDNVDNGSATSENDVEKNAKEAEPSPEPQKAATSTKSDVHNDRKPIFPIFPDDGTVWAAPDFYELS